jgi:antagonist of KipI
MEIAKTISIISAGLFDTIRDNGRLGFNEVGIPVNGVMDTSAYFIANLLVGNVQNQACIEMTFPAAKIKFNHTQYFALAGANFDAHLNERPIQPGKCYHAQKGEVLFFKKQITGKFIYLSVAGGFEVENVLNSKTTNLKSKFGGWHGRKLLKGDELRVNPSSIIPNTKIYLDYANTRHEKQTIRCIEGPEFNLLKKKQKKVLFEFPFQLNQQCDTMAYAINGQGELQNNFSITSGGVAKGTVQLLPNGNLLALMSDHQTTGGYPRILQIILKDIPVLVHYPYQHNFKFKMISLEEAIRIEETESRNRVKIANAYLQTLG